MTSECFFCGENRFSLNKNAGLDGDSSVIFQDEYVFITPDLVPLMKSHFLIVSKEHYNSYGNSTYEVHQSLEAAKDFLKKSIFSNRDTLFFEHGSVVEHTAGACIDHAHVHALPLSLDIENYLNNSEFVKTNKIPANFEELRKLAEKGQPYISYETVNSQKWIYPVNQLPSQFFRMIVASHLKKEYNWKVHYKNSTFNNLFKDTLKEARDMLL